MAHQAGQQRNSVNNPQPPASAPQKQERRMTSPGMSQTSLNLPEGSQQPSLRPPSPLRNGFVPSTSTGIDLDDNSEDGSDDDEDDSRDAEWHQRSPSPSSSVSQLAASFAQRVGSFVGGMAPRSPGMMPTDSELEAEAERERDRSRREAEAILTQEAKQRKLVEERVLAMMESAKSLPPPPSRSQTMPNPPSPSNSQKEGTSWWAAAKNRLTPTKEPLTPAQQIIQDTKAREKSQKSGKSKDKEKEKEWPASSQSKFSDPAFLNLSIPPVASPQRYTSPGSPSSPTPSRPSLSNMAPNLTPSPMRSLDTSSSSPSREAPPLYTQFNAQGTLDVHGTLLTIAKRFEKLEKWTVGHVRALEERMSDVERWLVDKEKEKDEGASIKQESQSAASPELKRELIEVRDEIVELQGRVGELGREMAKLATSPNNLSSAPKSQTASVSVAPRTVSTAVSQSDTPPSTVNTTPQHNRLTSITARESTSPPMTAKSKGSGTRLPYPTGDYASPPDTFSQRVLSPTNSPPGPSASHARPISLTNLPSSTGSIGLGISSSASTPYSSTTSSVSFGIGARAASPSSITSTSRRAASPTQGLPPPKHHAPRQSSISPTPRKRYTVALGVPISAPPDAEPKRSGTPVSFSRPSSSMGALYSSSPGDAEEDDADVTIGKSAGKLKSAVLVGGMGDYKPSSPSPNRRSRAQSAYGFSGVQAQQATVAPLKLKMRSRSTEKLSDGAGNVGVGTGKFIDPLVLRRQESRESTKLAMPKPVGKVPIGQLVAFFDGEKGGKS